LVECIYCGEEEATTIIINPNFDEEKGTWDVCKDCKEVIKQQQKLSMGSILAGRPGGDKIGEKLMIEANTELEKIANRTKKPILNAAITKKGDGSYDVTSVEFTGEEEGK